jgi:hypothetical protein
MARSQKLFGRKRLLESEVSETPVREPSQEFKSRDRLSKELEYNVGDVYVPPKVAQELRSLGYDQTRIRDTVKTTELLRSKVNREMNPVVFARIQRRYKLKMGVLAALASLCRTEAADLGLTLRSLVRFYRRSRKRESDIKDIERFVNQVVSRGETIRGVPSAFEEYESSRKRRR